MVKVGLHGKSFVPMLMGLGCNIPAIMATRTIPDDTDRKITILVNPLKISHKEAHNLSDILEHVSSKELETKLQGLLKTKKIVPLTFLKRGEKGKFVSINGGRGVTRRLNELGKLENLKA